MFQFRNSNYVVDFKFEYSFWSLSSYLFLRYNFCDFSILGRVSYSALRSIIVRIQSILKEIQPLKATACLKIHNTFDSSFSLSTIGVCFKVDTILVKVKLRWSLSEDPLYILSTKHSKPLSIHSTSVILLSGE